MIVNLFLDVRQLGISFIFQSVIKKVVLVYTILPSIQEIYIRGSNKTISVAIYEKGQGVTA
jgi:hypothetical protein